mmetsp:Transcript_34254/g.72137  ORF Transcript_34254/g.72137 Transcript_34254/m.72137 type:complete len:249 (+) Transcript_34254:131-877(+)
MRTVSCSAAQQPPSSDQISQSCTVWQPLSDALTYTYLRGSSLRCSQSHACSAPSGESFSNRPATASSQREAHSFSRRLRRCAAGRKGVGRSLYPSWLANAIACSTIARCSVSPRGEAHHPRGGGAHSPRPRAIRSEAPARDDTAHSGAPANGASSWTRQPTCSSNANSSALSCCSADSSRPISASICLLSAAKPSTLTTLFPLDAAASMRALQLTVSASSKGPNFVLPGVALVCDSSLHPAPSLAAAR